MGQFVGFSDEHSSMVANVCPKRVGSFGYSTDFPLRKTVRSDSDSDSEWDNGSGSTSGPVDKRLKIEQPSGIHLESTDTRPIKATKLALDTIRANEIAIENHSKNSDNKKVFSMRFL